MEKIIWVVEKGYDESGHNLIEELNTLDNVEVIEYKKYPFKVVDFSDIDLTKNPVMAYGTIKFIQDFQRTKTYAYPGSYATFQNYFCTRYYHHYCDDILNADHVMLTAGNIIRNKVYMMNDRENVFIRPDRPDKPFTGEVVSGGYLYKTIKKYVDMGTTNEYDIVLLSKAQKIKCEARIVVADGVVIDGSMYGKNKKTKSRDKLAAFIKYVEKLDKTYLPDRVFTFDVVELEDGRIKIAELSAFSCIGFYDLNLKKVVKAVNDVIIKDWIEYNS